MKGELIWMLAVTLTGGCRTADNTSNLSPDSAASAGTSPVMVVDHKLGVPNNVFVDDEAVYWSSTNDNLSIRRQMKTQNAAETIGVWSGSGHEKLFAADADALYWLFQDQIKRFDRASGNVSSISLGTPHNYGSIVQRESALYVVSAGCLSFSAIPKSGGALRRVERPREETGGSTCLEVDDAFAYCSNGQTIWRVPIDASREPEAIVSVAGQINGLAQDSTRLLFLENTIEGYFYLRSWSKSDGVTSELHRDVGASTRTLRYDSESARLFFVQGGTYDGAIVSFDTNSGETRNIVEHRARIADIALDAKALYWAEEHAIMKIAPGSSN